MDEAPALIFAPGTDEEPMPSLTCPSCGSTWIGVSEHDRAVRFNTVSAAEADEDDKSDAYLTADYDGGGDFEGSILVTECCDRVVRAPNNTTWTF